MIFISQSGLTLASKVEQWDAWYVEHLRIMRTVKGIDSADRFVTDTPDWPPSLAMYTLESADVFLDPHYQKIRGMGPWLELIDKKYYRRNLFSGLDIAPRVTQEEVLLVCDLEVPPADATYHGLVFNWLKAVGLDQSTPYRGLAVVKTHLAYTLLNKPNPSNHIAIYKPVTISP
jgi:hypothetical protein